MTRENEQTGRPCARSAYPGERGSCHDPRLAWSRPGVDAHRSSARSPFQGFTQVVKTSPAPSWALLLCWSTVPSPIQPGRFRSFARVDPRRIHRTSNVVTMPSPLAKVSLEVRPGPQVNKGKGTCLFGTGARMSRFLSFFLNCIMCFVGLDVCLIAVGRWFR